jgi:hypothetical protein
MERLPFFPDVPAQRYTVALDGVQYEARLVYRARTASWYLDLAGPDGVWLLRGQRLSPGASPQFGLIGEGPPGVLFLFGADPYDRAGVELLYFSVDELEAAVPPPADLLPVALS